MKKILFTMDALLLAFAQRIADKVQQVVGWNSFTLARITMLLFLVPCAWITLVSEPAHIIIDSMLVLILWGLIRKGEKSVRFGCDVSTRNVLGIDQCERGTRLGYCVVWTGLVILCAPAPMFNPEIPAYMIVVLMCKAILFMSVMYLAACTPKPPSQSSLKKWLERLSNSVRTILQPVAEPAGVPV